jgi:hypothetical protein
LQPSRCAFESRPFLVDPPALLEAMSVLLAAPWGFSPG